MMRARRGVFPIAGILSEMKFDPNRIRLPVSNRNLIFGFCGSE
jgi:hypothetical protein